MLNCFTVLGSIFALIAIYFEDFRLQLEVEQSSATGQSAPVSVKPAKKKATLKDKSGIRISRIEGDFQEIRKPFAYKYGMCEVIGSFKCS